jgi:glycosyltransferase involved in cell wall biosynthesis
MTLKIAIDATPLMPKPSGVGFYVSHLITALAALQSQENFELELIYQPRLKNWLRGNLAVPDYLRTYPPCRVFPLPVRLSNGFLRFPGLFLPGIERSLGNPTLFHGTNFTVFPFRHAARVMTIYDLTCIKYPEYTDATVQAYAQQVKRCLSWTDLVLTISHSSKQDIVDYLGFPADRIHVTPLASRYTTGALSAVHQAQLQKTTGFDFTQPYILFVSTIEPRKNIIALVEAFDQLKQTHQIEHQLVLIGQKGWRYEPIFDRIQRSPYRSQIHHLRYLSDDLVALFYAKADVFVYPSHYEGFGLPVLEAMTLGAPVIASNTSSLPEVAGAAAILVSPDDTDALADAILRVVTDRTLRDRLIQSGYRQAQRFSWAHTAWDTLKAYKQCSAKL